MGKKTIIIYGPAGCGKSTNAEKLTKKFGCIGFIDGWADDSLVPEGMLVLTVDTPPYRRSRAEAISFSEAIK